MNRFGLGLLFTARDLITPTIRKMEAQLKATGEAGEEMARNIGRGMSKMATGAGVAIAGVAGLVVMKKTADAAGKFEFEMAAAAEIMGSAGEELDRLTNSALSAKVVLSGFKPVDAAKGLRTFAQAGFEAKQAMVAMQPTLDMAAASLGQLDVQKAAGLAVGGLSAFNIKAEDTRQMLDRMTKAALMTRMEFKELPLVMGIVSRGVESVGASLEDTLASFVLVRKIIGTAERAATAIAASMMKMSKVPVQKAIRGLGVEMKDAVTKDFRPFLDIVGDMTVAMQDMDPIVRRTWLTTTFGARSVAGLSAMIKRLTVRSEEFGGGAKGMTTAIAELRKELNNADGTMQSLRDTLLSTWEGFKKVLGAATSFLGTVIGLEFGKVLAPPLVALANAILFAAEAFRKIPGPIRTVLALMFAVASAAALIIGAVLIIKGIALILPVAIAAGLGVALAILGKVLLVTVAVGAAIATLAMLWHTNFGGVKDFISPILHKIALAWKGLVELIKFGAFSDATFRELNLGFNKGILKFVIKLFMLGFRIKKFFEGVFSTFVPIFVAAFSFLSPVFFDLKTALTEIFGILRTFLVELGLMDDLVGGSSDSWKAWGAVLGVVLGLAVRSGTMILAIFLPMLKVAVWLVKVVAFLVKAFSPFISVLKKLGFIVFAVFLGPLGMVLGALIVFGASITDIFKGIVNFLVDFFLAPIRAIVNLIVGLAKLIPGLKNTQLVKDLDKFSGKFNNFSVFERDESRVGTVVPSALSSGPAPLISGMAAARGPSAAETIGARELHEEAIRRQGRDEVLQNQVIVNIDSDPLQEFFEIKKRRDLARKGSIIPSKSSSLYEGR